MAILKINYQDLVNTNEDHFNRIHKSILAQEEKILREQLEELVCRGLLVVERTQPQYTVTKDPWNKETLEYNSSIKLVLKDQEYIEKLEKDNETLQLHLKFLKDKLGWDEPLL